jgi:hypothetical protein
MKGGGGPNSKEPPTPSPHEYPGSCRLAIEHQNQVDSTPKEKGEKNAHDA